VPGELTLRDRGTNGAPVDVTVRLKGQLGSKQSVDEKPALKIKITGAATLAGLENLTLNNMVQDPTMLHEALGYRVYSEAGVPVPETVYARVTVNEKPYGLYLLVETTDRHFLARQFGDDSGILYEAAYGTDLTDGNEKSFELDEGHDPDHAALAKLIRAVSAPGDDIFYGPNALLDTRSFLSMMAVEVLINDWDNYYRANNYRVYWSPRARRWFFIPTGIDQTFTHHKTDVFGATGAVFRKCLKSERCAADYVKAVEEVAGVFERMELTTKMAALLSVIGAASEADPRKPYDSGQMESARGRMRQFIATRPDEVRSSLRNKPPHGGPALRVQLWPPWHHEAPRPVARSSPS
jgi:spore coat protein CotH